MKKLRITLGLAAATAAVGLAACDDSTACAQNWSMNPANPASPVSPLNPINPASPLHPIHYSDDDGGC